MGQLAVGPIFQGGTGKPLNLDNLVKRAIAPALSRCTVCKKQEDEHKPEGHAYQRDNSLPTGTAGTHFAGVSRQTFTTSAWTTKPSRRFFATATSG
jgi:hypothetical protein